MRIRPPAIRVLLSVVTIAVGVIVLGTSVGARQISAGVLATWKDLDTWTNYFDDSRQTEKGLGFILGGKGGQARLSFSARLDGKFPNKPPTLIRVESSADPMTNPNTQRTPAFLFFVDAKSKKPWSVDLSERHTVDNPAPGAMINDQIAALKPAEFSRLAQAKSIHANLFMVDVEFRNDQLRALQDFASHIFLGER
jgi:hypothetical protein